MPLPVNLFLTNRPRKAKIGAKGARRACSGRRNLEEEGERSLKLRHTGSPRVPLHSIPNLPMTSPLTPQSHRATLAIGDEQTARRISDLLTETLDESEAAIG